MKHKCRLATVQSLLWHWCLLISILTVGKKSQCQNIKIVPISSHVELGWMLPSSFVWRLCNPFFHKINLVFSAMNIKAEGSNSKCQNITIVSISYPVELLPSFRCAKYWRMMYVLTYDGEQQVKPLSRPGNRGRKTRISKNTSKKFINYSLMHPKKTRWVVKLMSRPYSLVHLLCTPLPSHFKDSLNWPNTNV